jgi:hypothetical protein
MEYKSSSSMVLTSQTKKLAAPLTCQKLMVVAGT